MRISDWSSDVCSSDLQTAERGEREGDIPPPADLGGARRGGGIVACLDIGDDRVGEQADDRDSDGAEQQPAPRAQDQRSEERRVGKECVSPGRSRWARYP